MRRQDIGEMYSILKQLGLRDYAVPNSKATVIPAETFKQHFQKVQEKCRTDREDPVEEAHTRVRSNNTRGTSKGQGVQYNAFRRRNYQRVGEG